MITAPLIQTPISAKFKHLEIYIMKADAKLMYDVIGDPINPFEHKVGVWQDITFHFTATKEKGMAGRIITLFPNATEKSKLSLWYEIELSLNGEADFHSALFHELIEYMFLFAKDYVKENSIKDEFGNHFVVPEFSFPPSYFDYCFQDLSSS